MATSETSISPIVAEAQGASSTKAIASGADSDVTRF
jgi:hypothetical protein